MHQFSGAPGTARSGGVQGGQLLSGQRQVERGRGLLVAGDLGRPDQGDHPGRAPRGHPGQHDLARLAAGLGGDGVHRGQAAGGASYRPLSSGE